MSACSSPSGGRGSEAGGFVAAGDPRDQPARDRIARELDANLMVEAGAGSGKTTELVRRMTALIKDGVPADQIAAVTFTRKAAAELRQRFQEELEREAATAVTANAGAANAVPSPAGAESPRRGRLPAPPEAAEGAPGPGGAPEAARRALQELDRTFVGTIHSFCARLLRQRPIAAQLDPGFREVHESESHRMEEHAWAGFLERLAKDGDPRLARLERLGIPPARLKNAFRRMVEHPDVDFGVPGASGSAEAESAASPLETWFEDGRRPLPPEVEQVRGALDALLDRAEKLLPSSEPEKGWDPLAKKARTLLSLRRWRDWDRPADFFDALSEVHGRKPKPVQKRWPDPSAAKRLGEDFADFAASRPEGGSESSAPGGSRVGGEAAGLLASWWAHRYRPALEVAEAAADEFAASRMREGALTFPDLLVLAARMLRRRPDVRRELGRRYRHILVDEFQDTDPLQAEILFLLASEPGEPAARSPGGVGAEAEEWANAEPRPGALFVVGDPKQSIYRFRRADISLYQFVKKRFQSFGDVLHLEANFRSVDKIGVLSDGVFDHDDAFPQVDTRRQAAFAPLVPHRPGRPPGVLATYEVALSTQAETAVDDAARIAAEIERRVRSGDRKPEDFLVLARERKHLAVYARALEDRNVPVDMSGGDAGASASDELLAFVLLFKCLADPSNPVLVLGVLAGPLFGVGLDQIARFRETRGRLAINRLPDVAGVRGQPSAGDDAPQTDAADADVEPSHSCAAGPPSGAAPQADAAPGAEPPHGRAPGLPGVKAPQVGVADVEPACDSEDGEKARSALRTLHGWWLQARKEPADIVAERLVRKTGLFPASAASPLGQLQAGTVAYVLDAVRAAALAGDASLTGAARAMEAALGWKEAEPLLAPGAKAVRVMNLHRAKGLEADVVFLAAPFGERDRPPSLHVARGEGGQARGALEICEPKVGWSPAKVIARPLSWEEDCKTEASFEAAERVRLLYVAATRARDELWVAKAVKKESKTARKPNPKPKNPWAPGFKSPWAPLEIWLEAAAQAERDSGGRQDAGLVAEARDLPVGDQREPARLDPETDLAPVLARLARRRARAGRESHRGESVSQLVKRAADQDGQEPAAARLSAVARPSAARPPAVAARVPSTSRFEPPALGPGPGGREWGEIAHAVLAAAASGTGGDALAAVARRELGARRRKLDPSGEPAELPVLMSLVDAVVASSVWRRALDSPERYAEAPFALHEASPDGVPVVVTGTIDLVFRDPDAGGWVVVDYKTDGRADSEFRKRVVQYRAQVERYAECWEALAGGSVQERVLLFAAQGSAESW